MDDDGSIARALATLRDALASAERMEATDARTKLIRYLATGIQELYEIAAPLRKAEMIRIYNARSLSYLELARELGVSKSLAQQTVNKSKPGKGKSECAEN